MDTDDGRINTDKQFSEINDLTHRIIGCVHKVSNALGCGFVEKVYENALALELRRAGLDVKQQYGIHVKYEGAIVGDFSADMVVEDRVIVELKAAEELAPIHKVQCLNYLKATGLRICLLVNLGKPRAEVKRIIND